MHRSLWRGAMALCLACAAFSAFATGPARTPEELIKNVVAAAKGEDVDAFLSNLSADSRQAIELAPADNAAARPLASKLARLKSVELLSKKTRADGTVELRVRSAIATGEGKPSTQDDTLLARQEDGVWKLTGWSAPERGPSSSQGRTEQAPSSGESVTVRAKKPRPER